MVTALEGYPFDRMTARFGYRTEVRANWKLFMDAFAEFYHAPVLHAKQSRERYAAAGQKLGFEAPHYRIEGPHRLVSTAGVRNWEMGEDALKPSEVHHLPLLPVNHYRKRQLEQLGEWLPREKLYTMPRSLKARCSSACEAIAPWLTCAS